MTTQSRSPQQQEGGPRCMCAHVFTVYTRVYVKEGGEGCQRANTPAQRRRGRLPGRESWHCASVRTRRTTPPPTSPVIPDSITTSSNSTRQLETFPHRTETRLDSLFFFPPFVLPQLWMKEKKHFWVSGEKEQEWREIRGSGTQNSKREDEGDNKKREGSEGGEWEENKTMQSQSVQTSARWKTSEKRRKQDKTKGGRVNWREEWEEKLTRVYSRASS